MKHTLLLLSFLLSSASFAQGWVPAGARSMSMGNASVTFRDVWAFHHNPGALGEVEALSGGVSYENRFLLKELQSQALAVALPLKVGVISVGANMYGYKRYRAYKAGLGYSLKLAEKISAGVQLNYQGLRITDYGSKGNVSAEAGIFARFTDNWTMGFSVFNLNRAKLAEFGDDRFSTYMRFGTAYEFSKKFLVALEAEKDLEYPLRVRGGVEYKLIEQFVLRTGVQTAPLEVSFGLGYHPKMVHIDFGTSYHQILGWSPHFSMQFELNK
jgi:hypothetical protein